MGKQRQWISRILCVSGLVLAPFIYVCAQTKEAKPTGSISGRVLVDGKPGSWIPVAAVAGASVNRRDAAARTVSDIEGNYRISGLTAGEYQVWTLTPSLISEPTSYPNYFPYYGAAKSIILQPGEDVASVDLRLVRGSVITGRVTNSDNKPVVNEQIKLQILDPNGNPRLALGSSSDQMYRTDDRGIYRIFNLPSGRYKVSAGYEPAEDGILHEGRYERVFYADPNDPSKAGIVELRVGDEAGGIDIRVGTAPATYTVSGRVVDSETSMPIANAGISFTLIGKDPNTRVPGFTVPADDRGEFSFSLPPGRYAINSSSEYYGGNFYGDPVYFEIVDKDVRGLEIKTVPGLSVSGSISADGLPTKEMMQILPNLMIVANVTPPANSQFRFGGRAFVAPDGTFQIDGLKPGSISFFISTQRPSYIKTNINRVELDGVPLKQNLELQRSLSGVHVVVDFGTGTLRGVVKFDGGETSIGDARMYVVCRREGAQQPGASALVDAHGHFVIRNLPPGPTEVTLQINSLTPRPARPIGPQKQVVNLSNGAETEVTFVVDLSAKRGGP